MLTENSVRETAVQLKGASDDYDSLLEQIGDARFVLLGEASHGTHEFYSERARITKRLIREKNFNAVAVEADWPDAYRVNRYVRGMGEDADADEALGGFKRFPTWMWRNSDVLDFVGWLRAYNDKLSAEKKVGFYGLDLYSLHASIDSVLTYLDKVDPEAAGRARYRYSCFEHFGEDTQAYGYAAGYGLRKSCEDEVVNQLIELRRRAAEYANRDGRVAADEFFFAEQNARLIKNAEEYYREMFTRRVSTWNLRDTHMVETLTALSRHLETQTVGNAKIVVWAHNSHLGDARSTQMGEGGELNVGQLVRERYGEEAFLLGFTTYSGTVTAASNWDEPAQLKRVRPGLPDSYEAIFHDVGLPRFFLPLRDKISEKDWKAQRLERAIGVIYRPESERVSHYFYAHLPTQFDAVLHFDETRGVEPLERTARWKAEKTEDPPETFPSGL